MSFKRQVMWQGLLTPIIIFYEEPLDYGAYEDVNLPLDYLGSILMPSSNVDGPDPSNDFRIVRRIDSSSQVEIISGIVVEDLEQPSDAKEENPSVTTISDIHGSIYSLISNLIETTIDKIRREIEKASPKALILGRQKIEDTISLLKGMALQSPLWQSKVESIIKSTQVIMQQVVAIEELDDIIKASPNIDMLHFEKVSSQHQDCLQQIKQVNETIGTLERSLNIKNSDLIMLEKELQEVEDKAKSLREKFEADKISKLKLQGDIEAMKQELEGHEKVVAELKIEKLEAGGDILVEFDEKKKAKASLVEKYSSQGTLFYGA
uniref:Uncharacterized protein n=1 Tax=Nelumbo nucifera TaxID=4432 RepID=A0A822YZF7_NELNU|nr:TPA_asm: hypothetical protein HUJ06_008264 [Nelumbo nucifera]